MTMMNTTSPDPVDHNTSSLDQSDSCDTETHDDSTDETSNDHDQDNWAQDTEESETMERLHEKFNALLQERKEEKESFLRAQADMQNLRKRLKKDQEETKNYVLESFLKDILPSLDSFEQALDSVRTSDQASYDGMLLVQKQLLGVLEKHGLERVPAEAGGQFDPNIHQAISQSESADVDTEEIVTVFQHGYMIRERLLRPAMVQVQIPSSTHNLTENAEQSQDLGNQSESP
ncbi:MAG: nucleotide exchange factor GrpE [Proteobacteria bacterium]|nr:nucleotide exchange factor GrpE [Pseudomonadota bacterium]